MNTVHNLNFLCANNSSKKYFQCLPSHVNICGNKVVDELAKKGSLKDDNSDGCLTFSKITLRVKQDINAL